VILIFGTGKLSRIGSDLGAAIRGFRGAMKDETASRTPRTNPRDAEHPPSADRRRTRLPLTFDTPQDQPHDRPTVMNDRPITLQETDRLRDAAEIILTTTSATVRWSTRKAATWRHQQQPVAASILPKAATMDAGMADLSFVKDTVEELRERWREAEDLPVTTFIDTSLRTVPPEASLTETLLALYQNRTSLPGSRNRRAAAWSASSRTGASAWRCWAATGGSRHDYRSVDTGPRHGPAVVAGGLFALTYILIMTERVNRAIVALARRRHHDLLGHPHPGDAGEGVDGNTLGLLVGMMGSWRSQALGTVPVPRGLVGEAGEGRPWGIR